MSERRRQAFGRGPKAQEVSDDEAPLSRLIAARRAPPLEPLVRSAEDLCSRLLAVDATPERLTRLRQAAENAVRAHIGDAEGRVTQQDVQHALDVYDRIFFGASLLPRAGAAFRSRTILGRYSGGAGIAINAELLASARSGEACNGLVCADRAAVFLSVLQHELCHLSVQTCCRDPRSHGHRFQALARKLFGHTDFRHSLGAATETVEGKGRVPNRSDFRKGQTVEWTEEGRTHRAIVDELHPRRALLTRADGKQLHVSFSRLRPSGELLAAPLPYRSLFSVGDSIRFARGSLQGVTGKVEKLGRTRAQVRVGERSYVAHFERLDRLHGAA